MRRLFKALFFLLVLMFLALVGFAYLGDLSPVQEELSQPVILNVD